MTFEQEIIDRIVKVGKLAIPNNPNEPYINSSRNLYVKIQVQDQKVYLEFDYDHQDQFTLSPIKEFIKEVKFNLLPYGVKEINSNI